MYLSHLFVHIFAIWMRKDWPDFVLRITRHQLRRIWRILIFISPTIVWTKIILIFNRVMMLIVLVIRGVWRLFGSSWKLRDSMLRLWGRRLFSWRRSFWLGFILSWNTTIMQHFLRKMVKIFMFWGLIFSSMKKAILGCSNRTIILPSIYSTKVWWRMK